MAKTAIPRDVAKPMVDWEAVERDYRAGALTVREIGRQHGVSHTAVQKRAKDKAWLRDLTGKVRAAVKTALTAPQLPAVVASAHVETLATDEVATVETAAAEIVQVIRSHRAGLLAGRQLAGMLFEQLRVVAENRDLFEEAIFEATSAVEDPDASKGQREMARIERKALMAAVSLPAHAGTLKDLATVLKHLIPLEREAFNVDATRDEPPMATEKPISQQMIEAFRAKVRKFDVDGAITIPA